MVFYRCVQTLTWSRPWVSCQWHCLVDPADQASEACSFISWHKEMASCECAYRFPAAIQLVSTAR